MKNHPTRKPQYFTDNEGQRCVRIRLARVEQAAVLYAEDFDRLKAEDVSEHWALNRSARKCTGYVKVAVAGNNEHVVARLITGAGAGQQVRYRDCDRLNLRSSNLIVMDGGRAKTDCAAMLAGGGQ